MSAAEVWVAEQTDVVEVDGDFIHAAVAVELDIDSVITVVRRAATGDARQGLAIAASADLEIDGTTGSRIVLWSDTAPDTVELNASAGEVTFWNVWERDGAVHAWVGEAGMRREEIESTDADAGFRLTATDGQGDVEIALSVDVLISAAP